MSDVPSSSDDGTPDLVARERFRPLRIWPPLLLLAAGFVLWAIPRAVADASIAWQMAAALGPPLCGIMIMLWWMLLSRATAKERIVGFLGTSAALAATVGLMDQSMLMPGTLLFTVPMGTTAFAIGAVCFSQSLSFKRTVAAVVLATCSFGVSLLLRSDGMWGEFAALELAWRWQPSDEERMLTQRIDRSHSAATEMSADDVDRWLTDPAWPGFRGVDRDSRQHGPPISADWSSSPPEMLWKIPIGPGWSSFAVAGSLLYTQEQRGPQEMIVCYAAESGHEIWTQAVETRFYESMGGAGPRATPTIADGMLFALGANGDLMRLQPSTGEVHWQVNLQEIAVRAPPEWGFSSSPLVVGGNVIVHAGGEGDKGTLAFSVDTGQLTWSSAAGNHSYSSPQLGTVAGESVVLMLTNSGLDLLDPATGAQRLFYEWNYQGYRVLQPQIVAGDSLLISTGMGVGTRRVQISKREGQLLAEALWTSRHLKPDFNDFVVHHDHCYGFDGAIFTCVELASGKRAWKGGRYGKGQVLLLSNSDLLLVASEQGEVALLKADPARRQELAKFKALEGKTWNHPVVSGDRLYIRNAREAACFRLPLATAAKLDDRQAASHSPALSNP